MQMKRYLAALAACAVVFSGCSSKGTTATQEESTRAGTEASTGADTETSAGVDTETSTAADTETSTGADVENVEKIRLYERGLRMIERMDTMAGSDTYVGAMSSSREVLDILTEISDGDYTKPKAVYEVKFTDPEALGVALSYVGSIDTLPEELKPEFYHRLVAAVPSMMSSFSSFNGASSLAAVSLITSEDYFLDGDVEGEILYIYIYDGSYCASVLFSARGEDIVSASGRFICNEALGQAAEEAEFMEWLKSYTDAAGVSVTAIPTEAVR